MCVCAYIYIYIYIYYTDLKSHSCFYLSVELADVFANSISTGRDQRWASESSELDECRLRSLVELSAQSARKAADRNIVHIIL